jgi:hypothetical protein
MAFSFVLGSNTIVKIAMLPLGTRVEPVTATPTVGGATAVAKGATSITLQSALPAGLTIPANSYLNYKDATGKEVLIQLSQDGLGGSSALQIYSAPETIAVGASAEFPMRLRGRTNADIDRTGNRVTSITFDEFGYEDGLTTSISQGITANGNWSPLDAGYATTEYAFNEKRECWLILELPKPSDAYTKGRVYKGPGSITSAPLGVPADGIITGNLTMSFNGRPFIVNPIPTP